MDITKGKKLLEVDNLKVSYFTADGEIKAVDGISYSLNYGEVMGIVGESGSGKSVSALSILGLIQPPGKIIEGSIHFEGENILEYKNSQMIDFRGKKASMIFQNPATSLNPVFTIGNQLIEALRAHDRNISASGAKKRALEMLQLVGISNPEKRMKQYPFEFSGGMCQCLMIAMALICSPKLLIADEATTALDATIQSQIIELIKSIKEKNGMGIVFITHNLGTIAEICDNVSVMYAGRIVEQGTVNDIFYETAHPYTLGLLRSMPRIEAENYERLTPIKGTPADMLNLPEGCAFAPRCADCMQICHKRVPPFVELGEGHQSACWLRVQDYLNDKETRKT